MKGIHAALLMAAGLGLAAAASPAEGRTVHKVEGGVGDKADGDECGAGEYLVGVRYRHGAWIDQIAIACARLRPDGLFDPPRVSQKTMGGTGGGGPDFRTCSNPEVVMGVNFSLTEGRQIVSITLLCMNPSTGHLRGVSAVAAKPAVTTRTVGQRCENFQAVKGFGVRFGRHVNALGLICDNYRVPAAPPPPVATTRSPAPPPREPLKSTGRSPGSTGSGGGGASSQEAMICRGGGGMAVTPLSPGKSVYISFVPGANAANLRPGECAWAGRPFKQEGRRLALQLSADRAQELLAAARGGSFTVRATPIGTSFIMAHSVVAASPDGGTPSSPASEKKTQMPVPTTSANEKKTQMPAPATPASDKKQRPGT